MCHSAVAKDNGLYFERDVRPILKTHCFHCHGEESTREGGLDVRFVGLMQTGGESGPALVSGNPDESLIWQRIDAGQMPPKGKGLSAEERSILFEWIRDGAKAKRVVDVRQGNALAGADSDWTDEERDYWAFQPVNRPSVPQIANPGQAANPIDMFLLAQLQLFNRGFTSKADRATLARRLWFDLLGLPPTPEQVQAFVEDGKPGAYERLVDSLLASPLYGERWARYWLDPVGYADSDGYTENDRRRPWAYRYRDYVIRSFNSDKPFDTFLVEQLAGDELVTTSAPNWSEEDIERMTATGFLRTAPDGTGDVGDQNVARNDVMAETIKIVSTTLMGMTVGCAQCHAHRYDPISHEDYHRIRAVFEPALDWKNWRDHSARLVNLWTPVEQQQAAAVDQELREIEGQRNAALDQIVNEIFESVVAGLDSPNQALARQARVTAADQRTDAHRQILKDHPRLNVDRGSAILYEPKKIADHNKLFEDKIAAARARRPQDNYIAVLNEPPDHKPVTYRFSRGDINQPREPIAPGDLSVLPAGFVPEDDPSLPTTGRRLAFARHLTSGQHPLLARTLVNRFWMHHFGRGIVPTPGDFGRLGESASHPELLDWLADEFVRSQWSLKHLHRLILLSNAYQQSSVRSESNVDTDNRWLERMPIRRLEAEAIRDAMLEVAGMRTGVLYGPASPVNPNEVGQFVIGEATRDGNGIMVAKVEESFARYRRSIYVEVRRSMPLGMLEPFDLPSLAPNCDRRNSSTVAPQSLLMMNNSDVLELSERFATRVAREVGDDPNSQAKHAWRLAFGVDPSNDEIAQAVGLIVEERQHFEQQRAALPPEKQNSAGDPKHHALALYCQALFSSNRFLYVD